MSDFYNDTYSAQTVIDEQVNNLSGAFVFLRFQTQMLFG